MEVGSQPGPQRLLQVVPSRTFQSESRLNRGQVGPGDEKRGVNGIFLWKIGPVLRKNKVRHVVSRWASADTQETGKFKSGSSKKRFLNIHALYFANSDH